ncbi:MAG: FAD-dependent oxidoreductase [Acidimicrobiia bacterium]
MSDAPLDLRNDGLAEADLDDGPVAGRVGDDDVVVARDADGAIHAVAATCTHYGGPLADGVAEEGRLHCPWHHAIFDIATGEAVGGPALDALTAYAVEVRDGRIHVTGPLDTEQDRRVTAVPARVVIVGSGSAGTAAAIELRRLGHGGPIALIGAEPPVDRPNLSKDYLAGDIPEDWLPLRPETFWDEQDIDLVTDTEVTSVDRSERTVTLADGTVVGYDALLIATGAEPRRLPIPGADGDHVHRLRTRADADAIIADAQDAERAVVVGAGFIGLEVAASLGKRDLEVTVVDPVDVPLAAALGEELGTFVRGLHEEHGTTFRLGTTADAIEDGGVRLADGSRLAADLVVVGVGVTPRTELAEAAGLPVDDGILVDGSMRTDDPRVWAAGDVARYPDGVGGSARVEHWVAAQRQAEVAARAMLGKPTGPMVPFFWSAHHDAIIAVVGHTSGADSVTMNGDPADRDVTVVYRRDGEIRGVATIFRDEVSIRAELALGRADQATLEKLVG